MENKYRKIYNKALDFHEKGEINKALDLCEIVLAENLGEAEILNFKGLMLYERGLLKEAVTVWKINVDFNKDSMAESYIRDAEYDEERIKIYKEAEQALKKSDLNNSIRLFLECAKSDFNCIKVNTGLAWCYQKKGDYYRAKEYVDKALKIDKNAVTANEIKRQLEEMDLYYGESKSGRGVGIICLAVVIIIALSIGGYSFLKKQNSNNEILVNSPIPVQEESDDAELNDELIENVDEIKALEEEQEQDLIKLDSESLLSAINNSDFDLVYEKIHDINSAELSGEEKNLYDRAVSILKNDGVSKFYEYGLWYFNEKDYINAEDQLNKAYEYSEGNNLEQHIIFYRGSTASEQGDKNLTLEMYKKYDDLYPYGSYIEGVLYEIALLEEDNDLELAKAYALRLLDNYPQSIYINDRIINIVNK